MATAAATVGGASGVVGINLPTFVERTQRRIVLKNIRGVVGINLPTFVERRGCRRSGGARRTVSSGLTSRPSLSVACSRGRERRRAGVVGINLPTFVERGTPRAAKRCPPGVVGINLPTFVERRGTSCAPTRAPACVVGINLPTFVERSTARRRGPSAGRVSSGLTSRPSLSGVCGELCLCGAMCVVGINLPTFVERGTPRAAKRCPPGVVGINLPTFVERSSTCNARSWEAPRVVGINLPTFVERPARRRVPAMRRAVSSGLTSRPSLSDRAHMAEGCGAGMCRRD